MATHHNVRLHSGFTKDQESLNRILMANPNNFEALVDLGMLYDYNGDFNKAVEQFKKALSVLALDGNANDEDRIKAAVDNYNKNAGPAEQITNRDVSDLFNFWALTLKSQGNNDEALLYYAQSILADPTSALPYNNRGMMYLNLGDDEKAIHDFTQSIELDRNYAVPYCNRGIIKEKLSLRKEAEEDYKKAIELDNTFAEAYNNLGIVYYKDKRYEDAIELYKKAIELNKCYATAYFNLGLAYSKIKDSSKSYHYIKKAYELEPYNPLFIKVFMGATYE